MTVDEFFLTGDKGIISAEDFAIDYLDDLADVSTEGDAEDGNSSSPAQAEAVDSVSDSKQAGESESGEIESSVDVYYYVGTCDVT